MLIGVPKEIKNNEFRVAITPLGVRELTNLGHKVLIQTNAGAGSGIKDEEYVAVGAELVESAVDVWQQSELVLKVKEPIESEYGFLRKGLVLFTYLHLAASRKCTDALLESKTTAIAYETIVGPNGGLPLLAPMSEVAGRLATQVGAETLMAPRGGRGVLLGGVTGVSGANVVVLGGGVAGLNAAQMAVGMQANVTIFDKNISRLRELELILDGRANVLFSNEVAIRDAILQADLVIGAVLIPGRKAPKLITNQMVSQMKSGSVLVDISIDQGGCFEDSRPTTHADPTYKVHNSIFYCVANMPGAVPNTSTYALTNATLPYVLNLAQFGWQKALSSDSNFALGLNAHDGDLYCAAVGDAFNLPVRKFDSGS
jgi:alanine dehydrogenase